MELTLLHPQSETQNFETVLARLYETRFSSSDQAFKVKLWEILVKDFLQSYIPKDSVLLDIAGGFCEFLNAAQAKEKHLVDLNPRSPEYATSAIHIHSCHVLDASKHISKNSIDVCFVSNFFEHLPSFQELLKVLAMIHELLKPGGRLIIIQPNYRFAYKEYFDFVDHMLPISDRSLTESLEACHFRIEKMIPRFLPFSTKSKAASTLALKAYLRMPFVWPLFGKQLFAVASKIV